MKREDLEKLAELSRIELHSEEEEKLLRDLGKVLDYFRELQKLPTDDVLPVTGGTSATNAIREDELDMHIPGNAARAAFPEQEDGYLVIPPVFSTEGGFSSGEE